MVVWHRISYDECVSTSKRRVLRLVVSTSHVWSMVVVNGLVEYSSL